MLKLKVRKFGNSLGIVLPKEVISRFGTGDGGRLFLILIGVLIYTAVQSF